MFSNRWTLTRQPPCLFRESSVVSHSATPRFLHVANGTSTTSTMEAAGIPGMRSIWADPLYEGPVPGGLNDDQLLDVRARFRAGPAGDLDGDPGTEHPRCGRENDALRACGEP